MVTLEISESVHTYLNYTHINDDMLDITFIQNEEALNDLVDPLEQPSFSVKTFNATEITILLQFDQPLKVSSADY